MDRCIPLCALTAVLALAATVGGTTYVIDQSGGGYAPEIQAGLNVATTGDTVLVMPGTYTGGDNTDLSFNGKGIVLRSHAGAASTIIDGGGASRAFSFDDGETADTVVDGFTVTNCGGGPGGAVYCFGSSPTIRNCWFQSNTSTGHGGAIYLSGSPATIIGCTFTGNSTRIDRQGGGIACLFDSDATVTSCTFEGNDSGIGSALTFTSGSDGTATDCWFVDNTVGCTIYCESSTASFTECVLKGNTGSYTGGVYLYDTTTGFTDCIFLENTAAAGHDGGGALYCDDASPVLISCTFSDNDTEDDGGTIYCRVASPQLTNCIIAYEGSGPAVDEYPGTTNDPQLSCCDIFGNAGGDWVGLIAGQAPLNDNFSADPEFCDRPLGDLRIYDTSPCTAANNGACGLVGALDIGCGTPVERASWGVIKSMYR